MKNMIDIMYSKAEKKICDLNGRDFEITQKRRNNKDLKREKKAT